MGHVKGRTCLIAVSSPLKWQKGADLGFHHAFVSPASLWPTFHLDLSGKSEFHPATLNVFDRATPPRPQTIVRSPRS